MSIKTHGSQYIINIDGTDTVHTKGIVPGMRVRHSYNVNNRSNGVVLSVVDDYMTVLWSIDPSSRFVRS